VFFAYNDRKETVDRRKSMRREYRVKPVKHKHEKRMKTEPSMQDPVLSGKISGVLNLSEDILAKAPVVTSFGRYRVCIENYRSILEYQEEQIRIQTKTGKIRIAGKRLGIAYYREDCMCVVGEIHSIEYQ
jgi:sporulation protein YqfC